MIKRLFVYVVLITALLAPAPGAAVSGIDIFNTGPFDCSSGKMVHEVEWVNDIGDIRIYNAVLWQGLSGGAAADAGVIVYRASDRSVLYHQNWDHYAEPTGHHTDRLDLVPNYMTLAQGDQVNMAYWCQSFNELQNQAHVIVTVFYSQ